MRNHAWAVLVACLVGQACLEDDAVTNPPPVDAPDSLALQLVAQGLSSPVLVTTPPGDTTRLFVVEQSGRVRIIRRDTLTTRVFLDLHTQVTMGGEQGLLSIAFHPAYATNGFVFASYTNLAGDTRLVRYHVSADPDSLDAASGDTILSLDQPFSNHNGGLVAFGLDGFLYMGLGDGGSGDDPMDFGQSDTTLLGKMLRINVSGALPYTIPGSNPFVGHAGVRPEIWAKGLRNPWRFSFDRTSGDVYIGDVGQNAREEVDFQRGSSSGGENYGWRIMEGRDCRPGGGSCDAGGLVVPVVDYPNPQDGCAVTGGYVYRGTRIPRYRGVYFYADYCRGWIRSFRIAGGGDFITEHRDWSSRLPTNGNVSSFGEDARGELYVVVHQGRVYRIVPP
jgi:glucose/arabinose dehydrogenase